MFLLKQPDRVYRGLSPLTQGDKPFFFFGGWETRIAVSDELYRAIEKRKK
ncbi:hypothetical protein HMPREF1322_1639 [Porphyromonas gingivalis W50]|nr:hypothetical protein HMPREF1322_1639 [Porphyromonas gingivalis W50]